MSKIIALSLLAGIALAQEAKAQSIQKRLDFSGRSQTTFKSAGVDFFFSDIPVDQVVNGRDLSAFPGDTLIERLVSELMQPMTQENFYQLTQVYDRMNSQISGQLIGYNNRSDDSDVNMQIVVGKSSREKLKPDTTYVIKAKLEFFTNVSSVTFGVGGSADSNSFGLAVSQSPWYAAKEISLPSTPASPEPSQPIEETVPYFGIAPSFFVDQAEINSLAEETFPSLNESELTLVASKVKVSPSQGPDAYRTAMIQVIVDFANLAIKELAKPASQQVYKDSLSKRLAQSLDAKIQDKLNAMSPDELQSLKDMFGNGGAPALVLAVKAPSVQAAADGVAMFRTYTKDSSGNVRPLGVPSGDCTSDQLELADHKDWLCSRYSYMGRINNGGAQAGVWAKNSISTQVPLEFKTDSSGNPLYLNINSHSGFEGITAYYVKAIEISVVEKK